ncbi:MAG: ComF family protein [Cyanophyceae cyanobacterium]
MGLWKRLWRSLRSLWGALLWDGGCALCRRRATKGELCAACHDALLACRLPELRQGDRCGPVPVWVWGRYGGPLRSAIAAWKYRNRRGLTETFGAVMADGGGPWILQRKRLTRSGQPMAPQRPLLVPVPIHRDRLRERGFNQAELLARRLGDRWGLAVAPQGLVRTRNTPALFKLKVAERRRTMAGAFDLGPDLRDRPPQPVVIVDDLYTTGTTAREAIAVLQHHGWTVLAIVALARPSSHGPSRVPKNGPKKKSLAPRPPKP